MKGFSFFDSARQPRNLFFSLILILTVFPGASAQTEVQTAAPEPTPAESAPDTDAVQRRIARARALAAVGRLSAAASELESLRASSADESVRDVARVLLMWIFVEMPDYNRANALLEETFNERASSQNAASATSSYYALSGQTLNSIRAHLERFRTFGLNVADADLPAEAITDLDQLRGLLERVVEHAKTMRGEEEAQTTAAGKGREATALLEDAASVRLRLARNEQERASWQGVVSEARQRLVASETRIASISSVPLSRPNPAPAATATATPPPSGAAGKGAATKKNDPPKSAAPERAKDGGATSNAANAPAASQPASQTPAQTPGTQGESNQPAREPVALGSLHSITKQKATPSYPPIARAARVTGVVTVHLIVNERGDVESVLRADGPSQLLEAATDAARRWKFHPTVVNGLPVRVTGYISFNFSL